MVVSVGVKAQKMVYVATFSKLALVKSCPDASFKRKLNVPATDAVVLLMKLDSVVPYVMLFVDDNVIVGVAFCTVNVFVAVVPVYCTKLNGVKLQKMVYVPTFSTVELVNS